MESVSLFRISAAALLAAALAACAPAAPVPAGTTLAAASSAPAPRGDATALPSITVHRDAYCGCCHAWVEHLRAEGFQVEDRVEEDMSPVKQRLGIMPEHASCHTAEIAGYVVEGHVPAADIRRLLRERPDIRGLTLPGMPLGSPGMEVEGMAPEPYTVLAIGRDGQAAAYAENRP